MINNVLKQYIESINDKNSNYNEILKKMKGERTMKNYKRKILNIAAIFLVVIVLSITSTQVNAKIQWDIKFKEFKNAEYEKGIGTIKESIESEYTEDVDMEYITQNGISGKVDSLIITDDYLEAKINFKFSDEILLDSEKFSFGYAIYDDQNNIYGISSRMHIGKNEKYDLYTPFIYEDLGVKYNKNDIYAIQLNDSSGLGNISAENRNIISKITMTSTKGFPKSKKLYIRIFDLGYSMVELSKENNKNKIGQAEDFSVTDKEWIFEIDVPEKFYDRQTTNLKLKDGIPGLDIEKISLTESGLVITGKLDGFNDLVLAGKDMSGQDWLNARHETINITDGDGNIYYELSMGTTQVHNGFKLNYAINKSMLDKKLFLNVKFNGQQYSSELILE